MRYPWVYLCALTVLVLSQPSIASEPWVQELRSIRCQYSDADGEDIAIARWGDSITAADERYFAPMRNPEGDFITTPETADSLAWLNDLMPEHAWGWQSGEYSDESPTEKYCWLHGNNPGVLSRAAVEVDARLTIERYIRPNYEYWLDHDNPEIVLIMFGSNDMTVYKNYNDPGASPAACQSNLREMVQACKANGSLPVLTTIPPHYLYDDSEAPPENQALAQEYYDIVVDLAAEQSVPLIDYYTEILARSEGDHWNGHKFPEEDCLMSTDGIHPSWPEAYRRNFTEEALNHNGHALHSYLSLLICEEIYNEVIRLDGVCPGDTNLDGFINATDLATIGMNWTPNPDNHTWDEGDFDADGDVDATDLAYLGMNWCPDGYFVPEPVSLAILGLGGLGLLRRRQ